MCTVSSRPCHNMMRRGLTLLEVMLALTLVLALGAIALPVMDRALDERSFETAVDVTMNQLLLARAHAQATGQPVEVIYVANPSGVEARAFAAGRATYDAGDYQAARFAGETETGGATGGATGGTALALDLAGDDGSAPVIFASWSQRSLPDDLRVSRTPPEELQDFEEFEALDVVMSALEDEMWDEEMGDAAAVEEPERLRLAVYLPDGSALLGDAVWISDGKGRMGRLEINPWTGLPRFERPEALADREPPAEEGDEDELEEMIDDEAVDQEPRGDTGAPPAAETPRGGGSGNGGSGDDRSGREAGEPPARPARGTRGS